MIRLCVNCDTENPLNAVICSECGMSLTRAPTGETAEKARSVAGRRDTTQDTTGRRVKWLRYSARALAVTWALSVTLCWLYGVTLPSLACSHDVGEIDPASGLPAWLAAATVVLVPWVAAVIPWRWPRAGAVVVLFLSVLVPIAHCYTPVQVWAYPTWFTHDGTFPGTCIWASMFVWLPCLLLTVPPGLLAALLLLATWWKSRTPVPPQAAE